MEILIAIDDTDNEESIGTGRLCRMLAETLQEHGLVKTCSVTRHQLLVHPDIPYTSHNSSACIEALRIKEVNSEAIGEFSRAFLLEYYHEGADPGLCVVEKQKVPQELQTFGNRAQREVITMEEARVLSDLLGLYVWHELGTGQGLIGAMAGVGLRTTGNDGRFIGLAGIRDLEGVLSVKEILNHSSVERVQSESGEILHDKELVDTQGWVRPSLFDGIPVLIVQRNGNYWKTQRGEKRQGKVFT